jgi:hypothetical protein
MTAMILIPSRLRGAGSWALARLRAEGGFVGMYLFIAVGLAAMALFVLSPDVLQRIKEKEQAWQGNSDVPALRQMTPGGVMHQTLDPVTDYEDQMLAQTGR